MLNWEKPLSNYEICKYVQKIGGNFSNRLFRGVFSRDEIIPELKRPHVKEFAVVNLSSRDSPGSHWVCYFKLSKNLVKYYDAYGNLAPCEEVVQYFGKNCEIVYNVNRDQDFNTVVCGQLSLCFLYMQYLIYLA